MHEVHTHWLDHWTSTGGLQHRLFVVTLKISRNSSSIVSCLKYGAGFDYSVLLCPVSAAVDSYLRV